MPRNRVPAYALALTLLPTMLAASASAASIEPPAATQAKLRVCADPAGLPYSDQKRDGFENKIATLIAADMHAELHYAWNLQRRSFFRRTLFADNCDVVMSVPAALRSVATTRPYFTSTYVFVTRAKDDIHLASLDDPWLQHAKIGLQLIGADGANTPPAMALGVRGITQNITGFPMWASEEVMNPQGRIVDAVASGAIDVAIVWGPLGGYFAKPHGDALHVEPVGGDPKMPGLHFAFPMAMGVRKTDLALRDKLQEAIDRHPQEIAAILADYRVPLAAPDTATPIATH